MHEGAGSSRRVVGGNSQTTLADHSVFDPATGAWTERAPLPRAMGSPAVVVHEGALHSIGGRSGRSNAGSSHASAGSAVVERFSARCS